MLFLLLLYIYILQQFHINVKIGTITHGTNRDKFFWAEMIEINFSVSSSHMTRSVFYLVHSYIVAYKFCFDEYQRPTD